MFEISMGAMLALILVSLYPSLLIPAFHMLGFAFFSAIGGGLTYYLASWLGVITQNAFWIAAIIGFLTGASATRRVIRHRNEHRNVPLRQRDRPACLHYARSRGRSPSALPRSMR